ncbi:MAG: diguanylate cyclase domain-containing protein, partial [Nitrospinales bacterium]
MNPEEKIKLLQNVEFFSPLDESIQRKIIGECKEVSLKPDEILFKEGEAADSMYLILSGLMAVFNENKTIALRTPGQYFGEMALIESKPRTASVKAVEPSLLIELNKDEFENYLVQEPKILRYMMQTISSRYRNDLAAFERESGNLKKQEKISQRLTLIIDESSNELYVFDDKDYYFVNANNCACKNLGYSSEELNFMTLMDLSEDFTVDKLEKLTESLVKDERSVGKFETQLKRKNGSVYPVMIKLQYWAGEKPPVFVAIAQDITESKRARSVIKKITNYDSITGLPNQTLLKSLMKNALNSADHCKERLGVLSFQVDNLKNLRGSLGDLAGDKLLQSISRRVQSVLRKGDVVSRVSRDDLAIFLPHLRYFEDAGQIAQKLLDELQKFFTYDGMSIYLEVKIGIAVYPDHGATEETLLKNSAIAVN